MQVFKRSSKRVATLAGVFFATALFAAAVMAVAAEQTREGYVAQAEPICKKNTQTIERVLKGVKKKIKEDRLKPAAQQFAKAANAFDQAVKQLRAVQQPAADATKLNKWLAQLETGTDLLREISKALKEGKKSRVSTLSVRLSHNGNVANALVVGFEFDHCLIDSSKFT